ncbi:FAD-dependent oxidoreductase [Candidatus Bathyarchaeota archaeon]|nr:FAD-dependent oxidoreductase [Candidatus Bathyarchaeota archaeon]
MANTDYMRFTFMCKKQKPSQRIDKEIAIIGAGPSGLAVGGFLACKGYDLTIYERLPLPGGMMVFGIPEFRIPVDRVLKGCKELEEVFEVKFETSCKITVNDDRLLGDDYCKKKVDLDKIVNGFDAVIIATGTWNARGLPAEGSNFKGIFSALEYLFKSKSFKLGLLPKKENLKLGSNVAVVGSGLVAVDAALNLLEEGHSVKILSIENEFDAPSGSFEIRKLKKKGAEHIERTVIKRVLGEGKVKSIEVISVDAEVKNGAVLKMEQIPGTERIIDDIDNIIVGIGQSPTPPFNKEYKEINTYRWGGIEVSDKHMSSKNKVFATGDVTTGVTKIGRAFQTGLKTAQWVDRYLQGTI